MGVTAVKRVENRTNGPITIRNVENPKAPGSGSSAAPGASLEVDLWIPWATSAKEFAKKHLVVAAPGNSIWIWQAAHRDGDFVRVSIDGRWRDGANAIGGDSAVDGDRRLIVAPGQGNASFAWMSRTMRGGVTTTRMLFQPTAPRVYRGQSAQTGRILTVRSHASFPVYLEQHAGDARRHIAAGETSTILTGLRVPPQLYAIVPDHIALPLPASFELEIAAWT